MAGPFSSMVVREQHSGITHFGEISLEDAGTETLFGAEHTDIVTIGPNNVTHIPLIACVISHAESCPRGAINHYQEN